MFKQARSLGVAKGIDEATLASALGIPSQYG